MLAPLVEQLRLGQESDLFTSVDPDADARFIHDITYGVVESHWFGFPQRKRDARRSVLRFCMTAIGASPDVSWSAEEPRRPRRRAIR
jgi:hypothetical protein